MASIGGGATINPGGGWLRDLSRWPSRQFDIDTQLTPAEIVERLRSIVEPGGTFLAIFKRTNKLFAGEVSADGFKVMRLIYYGNGSLPLVTGRFEPGPMGTRVRITMRLQRHVQAFVGLWFAVLAFVFVAPLFLPAAHPTEKSGWVLTPIEFYGFVMALASVVYLMVAASFGWEARKARGLLEEALQATPGPRIQKVIENAPPQLPRIVKYLLAIAAVMILGSLIAFFAAPRLVVRSGAYEAARSYVQSNSAIESELGTVSRVEIDSSKSGGISWAGPEGSSSFALSVEGTRGKGVVFVAMKKHRNVWRVSAADLREADGRVIELQGDGASGKAPAP